MAAGRAFQAEVQPEPRVWGRKDWGAFGSLAGTGDGSVVQDEGAQEGLWARGWGLRGHLPGHSHRVATMGRSQDSCDK